MRLHQQSSTTAAGSPAVQTASAAAFAQPLAVATRALARFPLPSLFDSLSPSLRVVAVVATALPLPALWADAGRVGDVVSLFVKRGTDDF